jgi:hypothetical protein
MLSFLRRIAELAAQGAVASAEEVLEELTKIARANYEVLQELSRVARASMVARRPTHIFRRTPARGCRCDEILNPISMACRRALLMNYFVSYPADKQGVISV